MRSSIILSLVSLLSLLSLLLPLTTSIPLTQPTQRLPSPRQILSLRKPPHPDSYIYRTPPVNIIVVQVYFALSTLTTMLMPLRVSSLLYRQERRRRLIVEVSFFSEKKAITLCLGYRGHNRWCNPSEISQ